MDRWIRRANRGAQEARRKQKTQRLQAAAINISKPTDFGPCAERWRDQ